MALRTMKGMLGVKLEPTTLYSGYTEPTVFFPAYDISYSVGSDNYQRKEARGHMGKLPGVPGMGTADCSFKCLMVGPSAQGPPYFDILMTASGMKSDSGITRNSTIYYPWSTFGTATSGTPPAPLITYPWTYSLMIWEDGVQYALSGGQADMVMSCKTGEPVELQYSFKGAYVAVVDDAVVPTLTVPTLNAPLFYGAALVVMGKGAGAYPVSEFTLSLNNTLSPVLNANSVLGISGYAISDRRPTIKINPEASLEAGLGTFTKWRAATQAAVTWGPIGTKSAGVHNEFSFAATYCQIRPPTLGERDGMRLQELELDIVSPSGGVEGADFTITNTMGAS